MLQGRLLHRDMQALSVVQVRAHCQCQQLPLQQVRQSVQRRPPISHRQSRYATRSLALEAIVAPAEQRAGPKEDEEHAVHLDLGLPRRRLQVSFTCNKCGSRSERLVNPHAWSKGTVFLQCGNCEVWHNVRDAAGLIEEVDLRETHAMSGPAVAVGSADTSPIVEAETSPAEQVLTEEQGHSHDEASVAQKELPHTQEMNRQSPAHDNQTPIPAPEDGDCGDEEACELDW